MEEQSEQGKIVLRASGMQQFMNCRHQWYNVNILGHKSKPASALSVGTSVHKASEVGFTEQIITGRLSPLSVCEDAAMETWHEEVDKYPDMELREGETFSSLETIIRDGTKALYEDIMTIRKPTFVEKRYRKELTHPIVAAIQGTLDIGFENTHSDIKVTAKKTTPMNYIAQQSTYAFLRQDAGEQLDPFAEIYNVIKGKSTALILDMPIKPTYAKFIINSILDVTEDFYMTGDESLFFGTSPTTWYLCSPSWCGFWDICPYVEHLK